MNIHAPSPSINGIPIKGTGHRRNVRDEAIKGSSCGLCILPPREDGSKAPDVGKWTEYQTKRSTLEEIQKWYGTKGEPKRTGIGTLCGAISGNLECFEFDACGELYEPFKAAALAVGLGELVERLDIAYLERSPSGGVHWLYRCDTIGGNEKLAEYETGELDRQGNPVRKALIETRGEGGYIITAPTNGKVHPTGLPYEMVSGSFDTIPRITPEEREALFNLARSLCRLPERRADETEAKARTLQPTTFDGTITPWDDFNARASWWDIIPDWTPVHRQGESEILRRPDKSTGVSATLNRNGSDRLYVFSSSTQFEPRKPYTKFAAFTLLNYRGDFKAATKALSAAGFGSFKTWAKRDGKDVLETRQNPCPRGVKIAKPGDKPPGDPSDHKTSQGAEIQDGGFEGISDEDLGIVRLTDVEARPIRWLWEYRLQRGKMALMAGDGGIGKSQLLLYMAAVVTVGGEWPGGKSRAPIGQVVIVSAEDSPEETILPRLEAMGADISRVTVVKAKFIIRRAGKAPEVHPASFQCLPYWKEIFRRHPECRLFIVDPVPSYLGRGVNDSKNTEIRNVLEPFIDEVITPNDICMIGNTHLNKTIDAKNAMHRISGSIAYGNLPRNVHFVVRDPDDPQRRFFKQHKCNNAPDDLPAFAFKIERREITSKSGEVIEVALPVFENEGVELNLNEVVSGNGGAKRGPDPEKTIRTAEWLFDLLNGRTSPTPLGAIFDEAGTAGLIGHKKTDGKWSNPGILYQAKDRVVGLIGDRAGKRVDDFKTSIHAGSRAVVHWYLVAKDSAF